MKFSQNVYSHMRLSIVFWLDRTRGLLPNTYIEKKKRLVRRHFFQLIEFNSIFLRKLDRPKKMRNAYFEPDRIRNLGCSQGPIL